MYDIIFNWVLCMTDDLLHLDYTILASEYYINIIKYNINSLYFITIKDIPDFDIEYGDDIDNIIDDVLHYYFSYYIPRRSYKSLKYRNTNNISSKIIDYLKNVDQPEQRTDEWYKFRYNMITASNAWKLLDSDSYVRNFINEKSKPLCVEKYNNYNINSPLYWGVLYEPLSILIYEHRNNTIIHDFGCIKDSTYDFIGASPDGINVKKDSPLYGRMLEIKNIVNRDITGIPKKEYWIQMQMQMNVCNLKECDFLETKFTEYDNLEEFNNDGTFTYSSDNKLKGIILSFLKDNKPFNVYAPIYITESEYIKWEKNQMQKNKDLTWIKNRYWKLEIYSCVLVLRNKIWYNLIIPKLKSSWNIILENRRINKYSNTKKKKTNNESSLFKSCIITIDGIKPNIPIENTTNKVIIIDT